MRDLMTFPDTVEEFMEEYKIIDTEQVYTNGAELVPIFRMRQWFEHLPTADAQEVRPGKWIDGKRMSFDGTFHWFRQCSECLYEREDDDPEKDTNYCPNCGAKMMEDDMR